MAPWACLDSRQQDLNNYLPWLAFAEALYLLLHHVVMPSGL